MNHRKHKIGDTFGRLEIICAYREKRKKAWWHLVKCTCGKEALVNGGEMSRGRTVSCGCLRKELKTTHGLTNSDEYRVWNGMKQRCQNPKDKAFNNYGGRGIFVCPSWDDFQNFINDMGVKPSSNSTIERVDNNKGYNKQNCIWADRSSQSINQRIRKDSTTNHKGVSFSKTRGEYLAYINKDKKRKWLGFFKDIQGAINARKSAELIYHK